MGSDPIYWVDPIYFHIAGLGDTELRLKKVVNPFEQARQYAPHEF